MTMLKWILSYKEILMLKYTKKSGHHHRKHNDAKTL